MTVIAGNNRCSRFAFRDKQGNIILEVKTLPNGDVQIVGEIYNREGKLVATIDREKGIVMGDAEASLTI